MEDIIYKFTVFLKKNGFSYSATYSYNLAISKFVQYWQSRGVVIAPELITFDMIEERKGSMNNNERTVNQYLFGIRKFLFFCGIIDYQVINYKKILIYKEFRPEKDYVSKLQMEQYLDIVQNGKGNYLSKIRDFIIIKTLWTTGMRISELLSIQFKDLALDGSVKILGKGRKIRTVFLMNEVIKQMNFYRYVREETNLISDYVFVSHGRSSRGKRLSRNSVEKLFQKINKKLGITQHLTPHSFRHGFATEVIRRGGNLVDLQHALGHSNIATTSTYLHSSTERIKKLQELVV